jgi:wobble nucleotide-excising tRNase
MTQTQPDRLDKLEAVIEQVNRKLDDIATDLSEVKAEARIFQARTDERFNSIEQRFNSVDQRFSGLDKKIDSLEDSTKNQDNRL